MDARQTLATELGLLVIQVHELKAELADAKAELNALKEQTKP